MEKIYLPIGSVVRLKDATKRIMIIGFYVKSESDIDNNKIYDYVGCLYPEGMIDSKTNLLFNHDQIEEVYALGFTDDEEKKFKKDLIIGIQNQNK